jgi:hypothetical protein
VLLHLPSPRFVVYLVVATVGLGGLLARPAAATDLTVTAAANQFGPGRTSFTYTANPGGQVQDGVVIANQGATPLDLALSASGKGVGAWVHLDRDAVTVAPGKSVEVPFTLTLPKDAAPGDYAGAIARIPIRLRVSGALKPSLSVGGVHVHYSRGDAAVTYTIHNTGNAILTARQAVSLSGPFGRWKVAAGKIADTPPLLPDDTRKVSVPLRDVTPVLRLTATVTLIPLLTDAAGSTAPLAATKASAHAVIVPWSLLAAIVILSALALAITRMRGRRRSAAVQAPR